MTFEQVIKTFEHYITEDKACEVLKNSRGYITMFWDDKTKNWYDIDHCSSPQELRKSLLDKYCHYIMWSKYDKENDIEEDKEKVRNECVKIIEERESAIIY